MKGSATIENEAIEWLGRFEGPLNLRLLLQSTIAEILGYPDGAKDPLNGAPPYFWNIPQVLPEERGRLIRHGRAGIGKVFLVATVLDCLFQYLFTSYIALAGAFVAAIILAILPYLFFRGAVNRWKSAS